MTLPSRPWSTFPPQCIAELPVGPTEISDHLIRFEDTCNVYALVNGTDAVLIDFGDGSVLDRLAAFGVTRVTDVLMTHHHRDQGQGLARAVAAGARVWVPQVEQDLFRNVDAHWQSREVYNNYNSRQDRFSLLEPVPFAGLLNDYATHEFGGHRFTVVPTPGHTTGSITLLTEVDGRTVAFTGDLIAAPGKVWSMAATQWTYNGAEGAAASVASLLDLKDRAPGLLLPSHGEPMDEPGPAIDQLVERLWELLRRRGENARLFTLRETPYEAITPHLLRNRTSMAQSYVLLSESGRALFIDCGYDFTTGIPAGADRASRRPSLYTLGALKRDFGVRAIDVALPTHYHDDHVAGLNLLREVEGTQVWAAENFAEVLECPSRHDLPCLWYDPVRVDRRLPLGRPFRWEEYELTLHELPGHTLHAVAIAFEVDGTRVLATGDQYQGEGGLKWNYVYQNDFRVGDYAQSAELYRRLAPDLIISGHWEPLWVQPGYFDALEENGEALERLHRELLAEVSPELAPNATLARLRPYQSDLVAGMAAEYEVLVHNPFPRTERAAVRLAAPTGWRVDPVEAWLDLDAYASGTLTVRITPPDGLDARRVRLAADLSIGSERLGQVAEALATVRPAAPIVVSEEPGSP